MQFLKRSVKVISTAKAIFNLNFLASLLALSGLFASPPASQAKSESKPKEQVSMYDDPSDRQTYIERRFQSPRSAAQALEEKIGKRLKEDFTKAGLSYPPDNLLMLATKNDRKMTVYIKAKGKLVPFKTYEIIGVSGVSGPKLQEGDKQIPEGIYRIIGFRTDVQAYMALMVDYPNSFDKQKAKTDKKRAKNLGSDILIHGSRYSSGCLAMGNPAIEELFLLTYKVRPEKTKLIIAPCDLRAPGAFEAALKQAQVKPDWLPELYRSIKNELSKIE